jgi:hypothetical protein
MFIIVKVVNSSICIFLIKSMIIPYINVQYIAVSIIIYYLCLELVAYKQQILFS